ncbi:quinone oxidoreductase family protein [Tsukamurella sp. DT100]|uniref:quinone oxidoreductase family protein n=1 Tax=Tsukamurella sp. DT100 TaxID=3393415 RepID=UPI003CFB0FB9
MRAIRLDQYGPVENYRLVDVPEPLAGPGEIRIKNDFAGVRWGDVMQRRGTLTRPDPPFIAGLEAGGVVDQVGSGVTGIRVGDVVVAMVNEGGYAEYVVAPAGSATVLPDGAPLDRSTAYVLNLRVAYMIVFPWAKIQEGETVLLHAAAGGVGLLVLQILKRRLRDVRVIGICSGEEKARVPREHGCDHVIDRRIQDYVEEVTRICGPKSAGFSTDDENGGGVDVSVNGVAGPTIEKDIRVIRKRGRWVIFGRQGADRAPLLDLQAINYDGITVMPFSIVAWFGRPEWAASEAFLREWLSTERLDAVSMWPLEEAGAAESAIEAGRTVGKVVLAIPHD